MDKSFEFLSAMNSMKMEGNEALIEAINNGFITIFENEEVPSQFSVNDLKNIKSFAGRVKYISQKLEKIGAGSSRAAFLIDDNTVLKLALNKKGLAQNNVESDVANMYDIVPEKIDADYDNDTWLIVKRAKKLTSPKRFNEITGITWENFVAALVYELEGRRHGKKVPKPDNMETLWEHEFFSPVVDMAINYDMPIGDLLRLGSYGEINGKPVLLDSGLTQDVYQEYYKK